LQGTERRLLFHFLSVRGVDVLAFADFFSSASTRKANLTLRLYIFSALQETHCCSDTDRHSSSPTKALLSWKGNNTNLANAHLAKKKTFVHTNLYRIVFCRNRVHCAFGSVQLTVILCIFPYSTYRIFLQLFFLSRFPCISTVLL